MGSAFGANRRTPEFLRGIKPSYADFKAYIKLGRDKGVRKIENETWALQLNGVIDIHHYRTEILRFYADGRISVATNSECTSQMTRARLWDYARIHLMRKKLPAINGRLPIQTHLWTMSVESGESVVYGGQNSLHGNKRITINADGTIDKTTVAPAEIDFIRDAKLLRQLTNAGQKIYQQCRIRHRLNPQTDSRLGYSNKFREWIIKNIDKPLTDIEYSTTPVVGVDVYESLSLPYFDSTLKHSSIAHRFMGTQTMSTL